MKTIIGVNGACGRMGQRIVQLAHEDKELALGAALEAPGHPQLGRDIGEIAGLVISSALNWHQAVSIVLATLLALVFGYSFASGPLVGVGMSVGEAARVGWIQERLAP